MPRPGPRSRWQEFSGVDKKVLQNASGRDGSGSVEGKPEILRSVTLGEDLHLLKVLEARPGSAIRQGVAVDACSDVEGRAHALTYLAIPLTGWLLDTDQLPEAQFHPMRAAVVTS